MPQQKVSEFLADALAARGLTTLFGITGGGAMHLNDALGGHPALTFVYSHHEQASSMAAEGYARQAGTVGVCQVTTGPGGTNAITGVCGAWIDSIPMLVISGQVTMNTMIGNSRLRQLGVQEVDILSMVRPITKYAVVVDEPEMIRYHLEKALHIATDGRPGPVWLDIPLDVQGARIDPATLPGYTPPRGTPDAQATYLNNRLDRLLEMLATARRPVLLPGNGVHLAKAADAFRALADKLNIPVVSSWNASDLMASDHPLYVGRAGLFGDRASNFAVQNADLLIAVGNRLSVPQTGHNSALFAREASLVVVDIDENELAKPTLRPDLPIAADAAQFIDALSNRLGNAPRTGAVDDWIATCQKWKETYPVVLDEYRDPSLPEVNSFYFIEQLGERLPDDATIVTDMGTSFTCTMQTMRLKLGQRLFTSSGLASMGFGLPGAIGACFARDRRRTICISGDGGVMFNIQELQTIKQYDLPITLFVLANNGYLTMKLMQENHFKRLIGADPSSGVSCPDFVELARGFGLPGRHIRTTAELADGLDAALAAEGPFVCEVTMPAMQPLVPRVQTMKGPNGELLPTPIEDMYPFLDRDEFRDAMVIKPMNVDV